MFNGYHSGCSIKKVLNDLVSWIIRDVFKDSLSVAERKNIFPRNASMHEKVIQIKQQLLKIHAHSAVESAESVDDFFAALNTVSLDAEARKVYIVIHSMDMGQLVSEESQDLLAELATIPGFQLVVSVDHLAVGRLWNQSQLDKFKFYSV